MLCDRCGRVIPQWGDYSTEEGRIICESCNDVATWECENCGGRYLFDYTTPHSSYSDIYYCDSCYAEESGSEYDDDESHGATIHSYGYKPSPVFHGAGPLFLGPEIEIQAGRRKRETAAIAADHIEPLGYLKDDSSVPYGFEIVTHPMSYAYAMERFPWGMLSDLRDMGAYTGESCGMHVHVSRAAFVNPCHTHRWIKFVYRNKRAITKLARRSSSQWASFNPNARKQAISVAKDWRTVTSSVHHETRDYTNTCNELYRRVQNGTLGWSECDRRINELERNLNARVRSIRSHGIKVDSYPTYNRYVAVNTENHATFELRMFASSLDRQEIQAAFGFAAASVEYAKELSANTILRANGWTWRQFVAYVNSRPEYSPLSSELEKLGCVS